MYGENRKEWKVRKKAGLGDIKGREGKEIRREGRKEGRRR